MCEAQAMTATHAAPPDLRPPPGLPQPPTAAAKAEPLRKQYEGEGQRWGGNPAWVDAEKTQRPSVAKRASPRRWPRHNELRAQVDTLTDERDTLKAERNNLLQKANK